jgi:HSP20 family protein
MAVINIELFDKAGCFYPDNDFLTIKMKNMYYNQSCAAKGDYPGSRNRHLLIRSRQRASVNIYKTDNSYEMLVFAPGRIKENFQIGVKGKELTITYNPPEGFPKFDWVLREYSRGGFSRTFSLDDNIDVKKITAKYTDGVLQVSLPLSEDKTVPSQEIHIG